MKVRKGNYTFPFRTITIKWNSTSNNIVITVNGLDSKWIQFPQYDCTCEEMTVVLPPNAILLRCTLWCSAKIMIPMMMIKWLTFSRCVLPTTFVYVYSTVTTTTKIRLLSSFSYLVFLPVIQSNDLMMIISATLLLFQQNVY